mgnify:CR=1 FL=1|jgi:hypothetical protein
MQIQRPLHITLLLSVLLWLGSCKTISVFDQYAYAQATALKVDVLNLMDKATGTYTSQQAEVDAVLTRLEKVYEYELHRPKNAITVKMWEILKNPERHLFGGFIKRWKDQRQLSAAFIGEAKVQVAQAFDMIVELESEKIKENSPQVTLFINANQ